MAQDSPSAAVARGDRSPPHSEEAERGVLGAILLDGARVADLCIQSRLTPDAFYIPAHRLIIETILEMVNESKVVDLVFVGDRLRNKGLLEKIGGAIFLDRLIDATPTAAHAQYYIDLVSEKFIRRCIIEKARKAETDTYASELSAEALLGEIEQSFFSITDLQSGQVRPWPQMVKGVMQYIEQISTTRKGLAGISTGFSNLDRQLLGLRPSNMIVLAARPSMGKTSLAMNIAENIAHGKGDPEGQPKPVGIFSLEMSAEDLVMRLICSQAGVSSHSVSGGYISQDNHRRLVNAADRLDKAPIFLDDAAGLTINELRARARRMKKRHGIEFIVVDYLQLLSAPQDARNNGRQQEITAVSGGLKAMAKELKIPVMVLSQLSRQTESRETGIPKLSDLRESGAIEQDADVVLLLRRPCKYPGDAESEDRSLAVVNVAKSRNGPAGEDIRMNFIEELTRFEDRRDGIDEQAFRPESNSGDQP
jgi:replicative DNA helicase